MTLAGDPAISASTIFPFAIPSQKEGMERGASLRAHFRLYVRHSLSLNKLEADILQGGPGRLYKKSPGYTHGNSPRARLSLGLGPLSDLALGCRAFPFFAFARASSSRYALVRASRRRDNELLLSRKTTSLSTTSLPSRTVHIYVTVITNHQRSTIISRF